MNQNDSLTPEFLSFARADFRPDLFDRAIAQKGYKLIWEESIFCSCADSRTGQPDYNCPICQGKGYVYFNAKITKALVTSINGRKDQEKIGLTEQGGAYLTPLSSDMVGFRDRFTFLDFVVRYSQVIVRGEEGTADKLNYPAHSVLAVRKLDKTYKQNIDFKTINEGEDIEWITDVVAPGESYSVLIMIHPVYIAIDPIHELRGTYTLAQGGGLERFVQLPSQFHIKREDLLNSHVGY